MRAECLIAVMLAVCATCAAGGAKTVIEWKFDADLCEWQPNAHLADVAVKDGVVHGKAVDHDPILLGPVFEIPAAVEQYVEIRMRADRDARAQLFWTETTQGKFRGFSEKKTEVFSVKGDGEFHTYRIFPFWQGLKKIIRLRLDPPSTGEFDLDYIRICSLPEFQSSAEKRWDFTKGGTRGWQCLQDVTVTGQDASGLRLETTGQKPVFISPKLNIDADENFFVAVRMSADAGRSGRVYYASDTHTGWHSVDFRLTPDGKAHTYNIDAGATRAWVGNIALLGLCPSDKIGAKTVIEWIAVGRDPQGPPEVCIRYVGLDKAIARAGRPAEVECVLLNAGGTTAKDLMAKLTVPKGVELASCAAGRRSRCRGPASSRQSKRPTSSSPSR